MRRNETNKSIKDEIIKQYGTYQNFADKTGYSRMYVSNVLNGKNPMSEYFMDVLELSLKIKIERNHKISSKNLFNYLIESSSLRNDLLIQVGGVIKDIMDNIELSDELCVRVKQSTYDFIKDWKGEKEIL